MADPRTVDCEVWARRKIKALARTAKAQLLEIRPKPGFRVLGGIRLPPNDQLFWPHPPWHYHFAVVVAGVVMDEIYPNGLPLAEYKKKFEHEDAINFVLREP
jgi:hypothetical protein